MQEIELRLTLPEINQILEALGEMSYKQVFELVQKIQQQAAAQIQPGNNRPADGPGDPGQN